MTRYSSFLTKQTYLKDSTQSIWEEKELFFCHSGLLHEIGNCTLRRKTTTSQIVSDFPSQVGHSKTIHIMDFPWKLLLNHEKKNDSWISIES